MRKAIGIDISKNSLDVSEYLPELLCNDSTGTRKKKRQRNKIRHYKSNNKAAFQKIIEDFNPNKETVFVMEPTGNYHKNLLIYLYERGYKVSLVNSKYIKNYRISKGIQNKTDKIDAGIIAEYGGRMKIRIFNMMDKKNLIIKEKLSTLMYFKKQRVGLINKLESLKIYCEDEGNITDTKDLISLFTKKIEKIEKEIIEITNRYFPEESRLLKSVPGIGNMTAAGIIGHFDSFRDFESARQAASYIGLTPVRAQSGNSVSKKEKIFKCGSIPVRKLLYMCALTALMHNKQCKDIYTRLLEKGKFKKQAIIAVEHKLIRQAFGVMKSQKKYDPNYIVKEKEEKFQSKKKAA